MSDAAQTVASDMGKGSVPAANAFGAEASQRGGPGLAAAKVEAIVRARLEAGAHGDAAAWKRHISADCLWTGAGLARATTARVEVEQTANATLPLSKSGFRGWPRGDTVAG